MQWFEFGECSTKYFHNLEKHNASKKRISRLETDDGKLVTKPQEIREIIFKHFKDLYTEKPAQIDMQYFRDIEVPKVKYEDFNAICDPIKLSEIHIALKQLNIGKCLGLDGFDPLFLAHFGQN